MAEQTIEEYVLSLRTKIKEVAKEINGFKKDTQQREVRQGEDIGEVMANLTLSYRHLEDASMRLGKTLQAMNGGVSSYDGKVDDTVVGSPDKE